MLFFEKFCLVGFVSDFQADDKHEINYFSLSMAVYLFFNDNNPFLKELNVSAS